MIFTLIHCSDCVLELNSPKIVKHNGCPVCEVYISMLTNQIDRRSEYPDGFILVLVASAHEKICKTDR